jgi:hypothetical protein
MKRLKVKPGEVLCKICWAKGILKTANYEEVDLGYTITELCEDCLKAMKPDNHMDKICYL